MQSSLLLAPHFKATLNLYQAQQYRRGDFIGMPLCKKGKFSPFPSVATLKTASPFEVADSFRYRVHGRIRINMPYAILDLI